MIIESLDAVLYTAIFLLPGFVIERTVSMLCSSSIESEFRVFLRFMVYSIVNLAVWSWAYAAIDRNFPEKTVLYWVIIVVVTLLGAIIVSIIIGKIKQKHTLELFLDKAGLSINQTSPTAWDYKFFQTAACFVTITLKNGSQYSGYFGSNSYSSSDATERDIYIETIYMVDESGSWKEKEHSRGIYIKGEEISTIEYFNEW